MTRSDDDRSAPTRRSRCGASLTGSRMSPVCAPTTWHGCARSRWSPAPRAYHVHDLGKARFDQLAKPAAVSEFNAQNELTATLGRLMARKPGR